jgi:hypothetical protein
MLKLNLHAQTVERARKAAATICRGLAGSLTIIAPSRLKEP